MSDEGAAQSLQVQSSSRRPNKRASLSDVLWRCRTLYNTALEQRITAYRRCGVTLTCYQQQAELPDLKAAFPEYAAIHSQVLQDVLDPARQDLSGVLSPREGGTDARLPALPGAQPLPLASPTSSTATARASTTASSSSRKIGRVAVRWSRPLEGTPKTVTISPGSGRLVCHHLLRRGASAAACRPRDARRALTWA